MRSKPPLAWYHWRRHIEIAAATALTVLAGAEIGWQRTAGPTAAAIGATSPPAGPQELAWQVP